MANPVAPEGISSSLDILMPPNYRVVQDGILWRSGRPNDAQALWLIEQGVKTVFNLEWEESDSEKFTEHYVRLVRFMDWEPLPSLLPSVEDKHVVRFLKALEGCAHPALVHCRSGQNRTGVMVASFQILRMNLAIDTVVEQFKAFEGIWADLDEPYIRSIATRREEFMSWLTP